VARRPQQDAYPKLDIPTSPDKNALPINVSGENSLFSIAVIVVLYLLLGTVSIAIDRRALMVSSLAYVLYAFSDLLQVYGMVSLSLAVSGVFIGSMLLLLSAYWHKVRQLVVGALPSALIRYFPTVG
tara:strand:- start:39848 stop:40228 length:381 start_codon:yes stop_codon:yes gene_type:complete